MMRRRASAADAGSGPKPSKGVVALTISGIGSPAACRSFRNPCPPAGYSLTSWATPAAVSAFSSRRAAPRRVRSRPPKLPTMGQARVSRSGASLGTMP